MKPFKQGALDGLCGVYSIVNSLSCVHGPDRERSREVFEDIIGYLDRSKNLSRIITEGLCINSLGEILNNVESIDLDRSMPFRGRSDCGLDEFWTAMQEFLSEPNRAVLMGMSGEYEHWTVVTKITDKRVTFLDSDGISHFNRANCTTKSPTAQRRHQILPTHSYFLS